VSSLQPRLAHRLLRCPLCKSGFAAAAGAIICRNGHSFDLAREGYVNRLPGRRRRRSAAGGDGHVQLRHRAEFLAAGHLEALTATIVRQVERSARGRQHVLDAGFGTGHHLARLETTMTGPVVGLGLDISKDAARHAARRWPKLAFAVADLWADWPVHDTSIDLVVSIFAPKNFPEMARVLRPGGWLVVTYPGPDHLIELRERFDLMRQYAEATQRYSAMVRRFMVEPSILRLRSRSVLDPTMVRAAILMGPNAHRVEASNLDVGPHPLAVTLDINVLFAQKPERRS
jgi:23S rRNA (guanine745-N1)-methyltransferase